MGFLVGLATGTLSSVLLGNAPVSNAIDQALYGLLPNNPKDAVVLIDLHRRGHKTLAEYRDEMKLLGYDQVNADEILQGAEQLVSANELLQHRRQAGQKEVLDFANGVITEGQYNTNISTIDQTFLDSMETIGFTNAEATKFREASREIPAFGQFLEFMAKEVFEPEQRAKFGLDNELPDIFTKFAAQFDVPTAEAGNYWAAHWNHISPEQVFEIFRRFRSDRTDRNTGALDPFGLTVGDVEMNLTDIQDYMKLIELPTYWRDRLTAIAFDTLGKIDLRWGYEEGLISQNDLVARLKDTGLNDADALLLSKIWARRFTTGRKKPISDNTLALYRLRSIDHATAETDLLSLGLEQEEVNFQLDKIDDEIAEEVIQAKLKAVMRRYVKDQIEEENLTAEIEAITSNSERTPLILEWMNDQKDQLKPKITARQLIQALNKNVINDAIFEEKLLDLGYIQTDIDILRDTANA